MHLLSNQTVPNLGWVAYVQMIPVPLLQWTQTNRSFASLMSFTSYLFMTTSTVGWISSSSHHGLTTLPDTWVFFPLLGSKYLSVSMRMRFYIPVMSVSVISDVLIGS